MPLYKYVFYTFITTCAVCSQKLVTEDRDIFWATDSRYTAFGDSFRRKRRCMLKIAGTEMANVTLPDGSREQRRTSLCCESVCFFTISGVTAVLHSLNRVLPRHLCADLDTTDDSIIFILGRYFSPDPLAYQRDTHYRPICPGPLKLNHCLWKYAKTSRYRAAICDVNGLPNANFVTQGHLFGATALQRRKCFEDEKNAYFTLHVPRSIERRVYMTREFLGDTLELSDTWIETVTLI